MQISSDEARALAFIAALIGLTLLGRWVDRPRPVLLDEPTVDVMELAARSDALLQEGGRSARGAKPKPKEAPAVEARPGPGSRTGGSRAGAPATPVSVALPLDLNAATAAELEGLPGVGPALAARIVAWRDSVGRFRRVEELDSVKGVGPALLERLKPLLRLAK